jgi:hypothetical protein
MDPVELRNRFEFHPARTPERAAQHDLVRECCLNFAEYLNEALPDGREKSTAVTKLEEVMFWANAAIARRDN